MGGWAVLDLAVPAVPVAVWDVLGLVAPPDAVAGAAEPEGRPREVDFDDSAGDDVPALDAGFLDGITLSVGLSLPLLSPAAASLAVAAGARTRLELGCFPAAVGLSDTRPLLVELESPWFSVFASAGATFVASAVAELCAALSLIFFRY